MLKLNPSKSLLSLAPLVGGTENTADWCEANRHIWTRTIKSEAFAAIWLAASGTFWTAVTTIFLATAVATS